MPISLTGINVANDFVELPAKEIPAPPFERIILSLPDIDLHRLSANRTNPVDIENMPITKAERKECLSQLKQQNPRAENAYWEQLVEDDTEAPKSPGGSCGKQNSCTNHNVFVC